MAASAKGTRVLGAATAVLGTAGLLWLWWFPLLTIYVPAIGAALLTLCWRGDGRARKVLVLCATPGGLLYACIFAPTTWVSSSLSSDAAPPFDLVAGAHAYFFIGVLAFVGGMMLSSREGRAAVRARRPAQTLAARVTSSMRSP